MSTHLPNSHLDHSKGAVPLYYQVETIILERIESAQYMAGIVMPSELDFQKEFSVSRVTVRQALNELQLKGYLIRKRGKGTIVQYQYNFEEYLNKIKSFTQEMLKLRQTPSTKSAQVEIISTGTLIAQKLGLNPQDRELSLPTRLPNYHLDHSKGAAPLYYQVEAIILQRIESAHYMVGIVMPSELDFQKEFSVSRVTVRQALNELQLKGYLIRKRGKGTIVQYKVEEYLNKVKSFTQEMLELGRTPSTKSAQVEIITAGTLIAQKLGINPQDSVYKIVRVCCADNIPMAVFITYCNIKFDLPLDNSIYFGSLYALFSERYKLKIMRTQDTFFAMMGDKKLCALLEITKDTPIFRRDRISFDEQDNIIEFTLSHYRSDIYNYTVYIMS